MHNAGTHGQDVAALAPGRDWTVWGMGQKGAEAGR